MKKMLVAAIFLCAACADTAVSNQPGIHASGFVYDSNAQPIKSSDFIYDENAPVLRVSQFVYE